MWNNRNYEKFKVSEESNVRPDLSFTIQEIKQKFTLQQILINSKDVENNYLLDASSNDFDCPPVEVRQNYDLVDAYADSNRLYSARLAFKQSLNPPKITVSDVKEFNTTEVNE